MTQSSNIQVLDTKQAGPAIALAAVAQWLMVLPASVLLVAAALRMLQPREYQPARASWAVFEWASARISHLGAAGLFIALPVAAMLIGSAVLRRSWRRDRAFREDAAAAFAILRRQAATGLLIAATTLAGVILAAAAAHIVTD